MENRNVVSLAMAHAIVGFDDMNTAPAWTFIGGFSWAGTYLLFPAWSFRLSQAEQSRTPY